LSAGTNQIAIGVVGVGGMGRRHAENLHTRVKGARVAAVIDADPMRAEEVAAACGSARVFQDAHTLVKDSNVDAVVVSSPDDTHAGLVLECLRYEKPVLCEKPLAAHAAEARKIVEAEVELGRKMVQVGFMRRYDPQHLSVKNSILDGVIGRPVLFKGSHRNPTVLPAATTNTTEFVILNSAVHDLDSARWLLEQEIEEVYVRGVNTDPALGNDACDLQLIQLTLSGGCLGTIEVYLTAGYGYEVGAEVVGEQGTVHTASAGNAILRLDLTRFQQIESDWLDRFQTAYVAEMERWIRSLVNGQHPSPDAWDGYMSLFVAENCMDSLRSGLPQRVEKQERPLLYQ
jgi:myo-inositol 2-dehydrogenase / D-chiro-inositol 1-dehydrogenase